MGKFTCGADVSFKGDHSYVVDCMGLFDTVEEAVKQNQTLHSSFGYMIYEIEPRVVSGLKRQYGMRSGSDCSGYPVIRQVGHAFNLPGWQEQTK